MNNKPNDVRVVSVELLERLCMRPRKDSSAVNHQDIVDRGQAQAELRAILAQPATAKVVLPVQLIETKAYGKDLGGNYDEGKADGWNDCLDEVAKLNKNN